jgi:putative endonuclease
VPADPRQTLGALGERVAARWYAAQGYLVLARRFRSGHRDLDLVVARDGVVAFVEVKTRRGPAFGGPLAAVHWRKRRELVRSARVWGGPVRAAGRGVPIRRVRGTGGPLGGGPAGGAGPAPRGRIPSACGFVT